MNRLTQIILGVLVIIFLVAGIWWMFFRGSVDTSTVETGAFLPTDDGGTRLDGSQAQLNQGGDSRTGAGEQVGSRLTKITNGPVSGGSVALLTQELKETSTTSEGIATTTITPSDVDVRYIERISGNVYSYLVHTRKLTRLTNQTVPGIVESHFSADGTRVFGRYLGDNNTIETYVLPIDGGDGFFLEPDLDGVALEGSTRLLTLTSNENGTVGTVAKITGESPTTAFTTALSSLTASFLGKGYLATTKPSAQLDGYAFSVSTSGTFTRIIGPHKGLATLASPKGSYVLYSAYVGGVLSLSLYNTSTREVIALPLPTLAEKCVWQADETALYCAAPRSLQTGLPDSWYQGVSHFSDRIWKIDLTSRLAELMFDPKEVGNVEIDATYLSLPQNNDTITFTNAKDGSLWVFDL